MEISRQRHLFSSEEIHFKELLGLANLKCIGQASRLETWAKVDTAISRQNFFLLWETSVSALKTFN